MTPIKELLDAYQARRAEWRRDTFADGTAGRVLDAADALIAALQIQAYTPTEDTDDRLEQVVISLYGVDLSIRGRTEDLFVHVDSSDRDQDDAIRYPLVVGVNNASEDIYHS
ncbi:hypothetical protein [Micromonospora arborensis]|uniref:hypothetical protein n=1 Tax=Micromonospora arborensis TaxID=2116518 RepID=UPI00371C9A98